LSAALSSYNYITLVIIAQSGNVTNSQFNAVWKKTFNSKPASIFQRNSTGVDYKTVEAAFVAEFQKSKLLSGEISESDKKLLSESNKHHQQQEPRPEPVVDARKSSPEPDMAPAPVTAAAPPRSIQACQTQSKLPEQVAFDVAVGTP